MNLMEKGASFLARKRSELLSVAVRYTRTDGNSMELSACRGSTLFRSTDKNGVTVYTRSVDFIIADPGFLPKRGDRIDDGKSVYEVLAPNGEQVYRFSDHEGISIRIHTKLTGVSNGRDRLSGG